MKRVSVNRPAKPLEWDADSTEGDEVPAQDLPDFDPEAVDPEAGEEWEIDVE